MIICISHDYFVHNHHVTKSYCSLYCIELTYTEIVLAYTEVVLADTEAVLAYSMMLKMC